ncbi:MAG: homoprotocatechuate degradation operon regulator HpaR [Arenicella sp.]|nr:homoprotocatechuate degradation operon regulator HpaR [Arenicella sp.]
MSQSNQNKRQLSSLLPDTVNKSGSVQLPEFDRSLPMSLLRAREAVMSKFIPSLKEHGLSAQQWRVIRSLEQEDGIDISELSKRCYLLKPSMSRIVQNLESRELIERRNVASDQRRTTLYLTQDGREIVKLIAPKSEERYRFISRQFGNGKLELLQELLEDLVNSINEDEQ